MLVVVVLVVVVGWCVWQCYIDEFWICDVCIWVDVLQIVFDVVGFVIVVNVCDNQYVQCGELLFQIDFVCYQLVLVQVCVVLVQSWVVLGQVRVQFVNQCVFFEQVCWEVVCNGWLVDLVVQESVEQGVLKVSQGEVVVVLVQVVQVVVVVIEVFVVVVVQMVELNLVCIVVCSLVDGYLNDCVLYVGDYVSIGWLVFLLVDGGFVYVDGYFEEIKFDWLYFGQVVSICIMGQWQMLCGYVQSVVVGIEDCDCSSGSSLLFNVNFSFNWVWLVQCVFVCIVVDVWLVGEWLMIGCMVMVLVLDDGKGSCL